MANDPVIPPDTPDSANDTAAAFTNLNGVLGNSKESLDLVHNGLVGVNSDNNDLVGSTLHALGAIDKITASIKTWNQELTGQIAMSASHRAEMGAVVTSIIGTKDQFTQMSNVSTTGLNTLGKQWKTMISGIEDSGGLLSTATKMVEDKLGSA